jgi:acetylornithine deacetylase
MTESLESRLSAAVDALEGESISLLQELVGIPSVTGHERNVQRAVARAMDALGLEVDIWEPDPVELAPYAEHVGVFESLADRPNVVGTLPGTGDGRSLILNAHIDTVELGERDQWTVDPLGGEIRDGRLYGRGSVDMKAGLVAELMALRAIQESGLALRGRVHIQSAISEEDGGAGALATILRGYTADAAIITEPTELAIIPAQGGSLVFRMTVTGRSAHACVRNEGVSALEAFLPLHAALLAHERAHHEAISHPLYQHYDNRAPINIGTVRAGNWPSSVPEFLVVEGRAGLVPGESLDETRRALLAAIDEVVVRDEWLRAHPPLIEWFSGQFAAAETPVDHPLVHTLEQSHRKVTGTGARFDASTYGADMRHFTNIGRIPCVMYGAGDVRMAHRPDEFVPLQELKTLISTLAVFMVDWCGADYPGERA